MVEPSANDDPTVHSFVEMEPVKNIDNPLRSRATSSGPSKSKRPLRSYGLTPYQGHSRTIKGVSEDHIRVYDYGPASYGGVDFGTELAYVDTRTEKILFYDKGWGLDPFDQENPDVLWVHGNTDVFNVPNFMVHFLEHIFLPFSVPFMSLRKGSWYTKMQGLQCPPDGGFFGFKFAHNFVFPTLFWIMVGLHVTNRRQFCRNGIVGAETAVTFVALAFHRAAIALKYANLSNAEYERFWATRDLEKTNEWINEMQMVTGFFEMRPKLCHWEVDACLKRSGLAPAVAKSAKLHVLNPTEENLNKWRTFLGTDVCLFDLDPSEEILHFPNEEELREGATFSTPILKVLRSLIGTAREDAQIPYHIPSIYTLSFVFAAIPYIMRGTCGGDNAICLAGIEGGEAIDDDDEAFAISLECGQVVNDYGRIGATMGANAQAVIYMVIAFMVRFDFIGINFLFLSLSIIDNYRTMVMVTKLGDLIRPAFTMVSTSPQLTWSANNILHWVHLYILTLEFGKRTQSRIEALYKMNSFMVFYAVVAVAITFASHLDDLKTMK